MVYNCPTRAGEERPWTISKYPINTVADAPIPTSTGQSLQVSDTVLPRPTNSTDPSYRLLRIERPAGERLYIKLSCIVVSETDGDVPGTEQNQVVESQFLVGSSQQVQYFGFITLTDSIVSVDAQQLFVDILIRRPNQGAVPIFYNASVEVRPLSSNIDNVHVCFENDGRVVRRVASL